MDTYCNLHWVLCRVLFGSISLKMTTGSFRDEIINYGLCEFLLTLIVNVTFMDQIEGQSRAREAGILKRYVSKYWQFDN